MASVPTAVAGGGVAVAAGGGDTGGSAVVEEKPEEKQEEEEEDEVHSFHWIIESCAFRIWDFHSSIRTLENRFCKTRSVYGAIETRFNST